MPLICVYTPSPHPHAPFQVTQRRLLHQQMEKQTSLVLGAFTPSVGVVGTRQPDKVRSSLDSRVYGMRGPWQRAPLEMYDQEQGLPTWSQKRKREETHIFTPRDRKPRVLGKVQEPVCASTKCRPGRWGPFLGTLRPGSRMSHDDLSSRRQLGLSLFASHLTF